MMTLNVLRVLYARIARDIMLYEIFSGCHIIWSRDYKYIIMYNANIL